MRILMTAHQEVDMLLRDKIAVVYGAGAVGGAVARAFAQHGATVCLAGRSGAAVEAVARDITAAGGRAHAARVDATDADAVQRHLDDLLDRTGRLDVSFNAIGLEDLQGAALTDMALADVLRPVQLAVTTHFITATAAARHMTRAGSGVILALTAQVPVAEHGGFGVACAATALLLRQLALEVGPHGVRVLTLTSAGSPDAPGVDDVFGQHAQRAGLTRAEFEARVSRGAALRRLPRLAEIGQAAVLAASDLATAMTASALDVTCGATR